MANMGGDGPDLATEVDETLGPDVPAAKSELAPSRKAIAAARLLVMGATPAEIAETLGYVTPAHAQMAADGALASIGDPSTDFASRRRLRMGQLDALIKAAAPRALNATITEEQVVGDKVVKLKRPNEEQATYATLMLRLVDRAIKLEGLDAPQVMTLVTPDVKGFEAVVQTLVAAARSESAPEADIFALTQGADGVFSEDGETDADNGAQ